MFIVKKLRKDQRREKNTCNSITSPGRNPTIIFLYIIYFKYTCFLAVFSQRGHVDVTGRVFSGFNVILQKEGDMGCYFQKGSQSFKSPTWPRIQHFLSLHNCKYLPAYFICLLSAIYIWPASC